MKKPSLKIIGIILVNLILGLILPFGILVEFEFRYISSLFVFVTSAGGNTIVVNHWIVLLMSIFMVAPLLNFNYIIYTRNPHRSIRKLLIGTLVSYMILEIMLLPLIYYINYMIGVGSAYYSYYGYGSWSVVLMVIIPLITRELAFTEKQFYFRVENSSDSDNSIDWKVTLHDASLRTVIHGILLGLVFILAPIHIQNIPYSAFTNVALSFGNILINQIGYTTAIHFSLRIGFQSFYSLIFIWPQIALLFSYLKYRYMKSSFQRILIFGVLSVIYVPSIFLIMIGYINVLSFTVLPIPILFIVILFLTYFQKQVSHRHEVWDDVRSTVWFEEGEEQESHQKSEEIRVPLSMRIRSIFKRKESTSLYSTSDEESEEDYWDSQKEDIWKD